MHTTSRDGSDNNGNNDCNGNNNIGSLLGRILDQEGDVVTERRMDPLVVFLPPPDARCKEDGLQTVIFLYIHYVQNTTSFQSRLCIPSDSGRIPTEVGQKSPAGKDVKVRSTGMRYPLVWAKKVSLAAICLVAGSASFGLREN